MENQTEMYVLKENERNPSNGDGNENDDEDDEIAKYIEMTMLDFFPLKTLERLK